MDPNSNQNQAEKVAPLADLQAQKDTRPPLQQVLLGLGLLAGSITIGFVLISAYLPTVSLQTPGAQAAAAAVRERIEIFETIKLSARAAYVYDISTDKELFAKNASAQLPPASIVKVALALVVSEVLPSDGRVAISREAVAEGEGGLTWGEEWRVKDLLDYTLMASSNTGAVALAEAADAALHAKYPGAPEGEATVWRMNALAQQLGMNETYFVNPSGLDESTTQAGALSSARDIKTLFEYAARTNPDLFSITRESNATLGPTNAPERHAVNTNDALADIADIVIGKTGTTDLAGANIAIAFTPVQDHVIVIVILGSTPEARFDDLRQLVEAARAAVKEE